MNLTALCVVGVPFQLPVFVPAAKSKMLCGFTKAASTKVFSARAIHRGYILSCAKALH